MVFVIGAYGAYFGLRSYFAAASLFSPTSPCLDLECRRLCRADGVEGAKRQLNGRPHPGEFGRLGRSVDQNC